MAYNGGPETVFPSVKMLGSSSRGIPWEVGRLQRTNIL